VKEAHNQSGRAVPSRAYPVISVINSVGIKIRRSAPTVTTPSERLSREPCGRKPPAASKDAPIAPPLFPWPAAYYQLWRANGARHGVTSGIGRATAIAFAREGAKVVVAGRRTVEGEATARLINETSGEALVPLGRRATVMVTSGDAGYEPGGPIWHMNHVEPHLRTILSFVGITDLRFVYAGNDEFGGDRLERSLEAAARRVVEVTTPTAAITQNPVATATRSSQRPVATTNLIRQIRASRPRVSLERVRGSWAITRMRIENVWHRGDPKVLFPDQPTKDENSH
jgi:hypothetical protein